MRRREFIALLGGAAVGWPLAAHAQQPEQMRRIGVLLGSWSASDPGGQILLRAFLEALQKLGWTDGRNVLDRLPSRLPVDTDQLRTLRNGDW